MTGILLVWMLGCTNGKTEENMEGVSFVDFCGYPKCPVLSNASARVALGPHCGGRILEYSLHGKNVIKLDPKQDGWIYRPANRPSILAADVSISARRW